MLGTANVPRVTILILNEYYIILYYYYSLQVLGTANVDEALRGYYTNYIILYIYILYCIVLYYARISRTMFPARSASSPGAGGAGRRTGRGPVCACPQARRRAGHFLYSILYYITLYCIALSVL